MVDRILSYRQSFVYKKKLKKEQIQKKIRYNSFYFQNLDKFVVLLFYGFCLMFVNECYSSGYIDGELEQQMQGFMTLLPLISVCYCA